ncbi:MAG TPA: YbaY family lipoprotein [Hyalangium sp.]|nr:YbaY family lipoprotein [Hyalangium sp.]
MIRPMLTLATCLAALTWAACASTAPSTQGGSTDSTSQPDSETQATPGPANETTPPPSNQLPDAAAQVTGSVMYRERIALTPAAVVQVEVVELTKEGSPGTVIGQQTIQSPSQVPIPFTVVINPQLLRADATYVVNARITDGGRVFSTAAPVPVLTQGNRSSEVQVLVRSGG